MKHELKQVDVRLKLVDKEGVFSMEPIDTPAKAVAIMAPILAELDREEVCVVNLDGKNHPINFNIVSIGSLNASLVTGREVYKSAVLSNAARVILLHNHPSSSLAPSREDREVTGKMMYAGSFLDIELQDHIIVAGRTGETFSMREHLPELFDRKNYMEPMAHVADLVREEATGSEVSPVTYEILQIKDGSNGEAYRFMGTRYIRQQQLPVNVSDYESKYKGELKPGETLDTLYERFNIHRPDDFTGHSLSVSDVIVLESEGKKTPFYVDSFGFQKLKNFFEERFVRTEAEKKIISDFREKTQKYFRPVDGRKAEEIENNVREYLHKKVREQGLPIQFGEVLLYGSRSRGTEKQTSDLDVLVEYKGTSREDDLFNLFHEDDFCIGGCKVDINPIKEEKSGSLTAFLQQAVYFMESEMAFSIADRYIYIQDATEGYDCTIYDSDFTELDGGVYDNPEISIYEALDEIVEDLKMQPDTDRIKGEITEESKLIPINLEEFEEALERSHYVPPEVTYTVAECGEFHGMGWHRDDIKDVQEAIALWKEFQDSPLNGIPSIGILVHTPGQTDLEDEQLDLLSGQKIDLDMMQYYLVIYKEEGAIEKICELIENLPEVGIIGKVPERISTELLLRELDPGKSLFSEEEKSLIRKYGLQMKDEQKTRRLAEKLCSRDKIGNQDVVLAVAKAKEEIREMQRKLQEHTIHIL